MTKSELIFRLSRHFPNISSKAIEKAVNTIIAEMSQVLSRGERIELRGFGAFSVRERQARNARNPRTGEKVKLSDRRAIHFRTGKLLRDRINKRPVKK
jgi:integration host factor subunit beta